MDIVKNILNMYCFNELQIHGEFKCWKFEN